MPSVWPLRPQYIVRFWKVQAIGNDFPLVRLENVNPDKLPELAIRMADRRFGVGGDGLLAMGSDADGGPRLRMFNPDGTEDFCGNGLRAAAWWAFQEGLAGKTFTLRHLEREVEVQIEDDLVTTILGKASYTPADVPHTHAQELFDTEVFPGRPGSAITTGSTHVVLWTEDLPESPDFEAASAQYENDPRFPFRTSVIWSKRTGENEIAIRIWERGVGETLGCGTGSTAAAADLMRRRGSGGTIEVQNRGGSVKVSAEAWNAPLQISGTATIVYQGDL
ncbi:diaminopimelate epimerase [soil metagenome]